MSKKLTVKENITVIYYLAQWCIIIYLSNGNNCGIVKNLTAFVPGSWEGDFRSFDPE